MTIDLTTFPDTYIRCRTLGHRWEDFVPVGMPKPWYGHRVSLLCTSCGMERHDLIDTHGDVGNRNYRAPDGYTITGGAPDRADFRLEMIRRKSVKMVKA